MLPCCTLRSCLPLSKPCEPCPQCLTQSPASLLTSVPFFPFSKHHASLSFSASSSCCCSFSSSSLYPLSKDPSRMLTGPSSSPTPLLVHAVLWAGCRRVSVCTCAETRGHRADCKSVRSGVPWNETRASRHHTPPHGQQIDSVQVLFTTNRKLIANYFDIHFIISS